jgi:hypothetical protein
MFENIRRVINNCKSMKDRTKYLPKDKKKDKQ